MKKGDAEPDFDESFPDFNLRGGSSNVQSRRTRRLRLLGPEKRKCGFYFKKPPVSAGDSEIKRRMIVHMHEGYELR